MLKDLEMEAMRQNLSRIPAHQTPSPTKVATLPPSLVEAQRQLAERSLDMARLLSGRQQATFQFLRSEQ